MSLNKAVEAFKQKALAPFHMPGHKGRPPYEAGDLFFSDITEVAGADSLYQADGAIALLEQEYARLYGSAASLLSAGGSTLCIQTMLALVLGEGDGLVLSRTVHRATVAAMGLLGVHPIWVWPATAKKAGIPHQPLPVTPTQIEGALQANPKAAAVLVTSPDYSGQLCDLAAIARVCRSRGKPLLVDNAHGAHLAFLPQSLHPMRLGADLCCDSLHKTLPVLTGGAMLHIKDPALAPAAKQVMALFGSTSPSYPVMISANRALPYLQGPFSGELLHLCRQLERLGQTAARRGFALPARPCDPMRLTLGYRGMGYSDDAFGQIIRNCGIEPEYVAGGVCVLMASPQNTGEDLARLGELIALLPALPSLPYDPPLPGPLPVAMELRQAMLAPREALPNTPALAGRVAAVPFSVCPPGVPLAAPGEVLTPQALRALEMSGAKTLCVVK